MNPDAPADLRFLIRATVQDAGTPYSLQNLNTIPLPDGACCYVLDDKSIWSLDKTSTLPSSVGLVVIPGSGPGRWILLAASSGAGGAVLLRSSDVCAFAADGNFNQSSASNFELTEGADAHPGWALTASGGILTYSGPTRSFMVVLAATVSVADAGTPRGVYGEVSYNNDGSGAIGLGDGALLTTCAVVSQAYSLSVVRHIVTMASGDTLRPKLGTESGAASISAWLTMGVTPA